jgi:DNA-binding NtrC family response regulator
MQGLLATSAAPPPDALAGVVGDSPAIRKIRDVVRQVAPTEITVLVTGESGVGKEVIAKAIHALSARASKALVTVNCGAIPEGIIESELFGHERGSFTGASEQRKGYFELADGGTIFLDEIGELPLSAQVKFLRVMENGEFVRVGSSVPRRVNVRVIAATNKDLETEVRTGRFRPDLYFRLRSVNILVPPLRTRPEDIAALVGHFAADLSARNAIRFAGFSPEALQLLIGYAWPGNVRELRNLVESLLVLGKGRTVTAEDVRPYLKEHMSPDERNLPVPLAKSVEQAERELILRALLDIKGNLLEVRQELTQLGRSLETARQERDPMAVAENNRSLTLEEMERKMIVEALERYQGNRRSAARALNISERTLYRKIKEYGLG